MVFFRILVAAFAFLICTSQKIKADYIKSPQIFLCQIFLYRMRIHYAGCESLIFHPFVPLSEGNSTSYYILQPLQSLLSRNNARYCDCFDISICILPIHSISTKVFDILPQNNFMCYFFILEFVSYPLLCGKCFDIFIFFTLC